MPHEVETVDRPDPQPEVANRSSAGTDKESMTRKHIRGSGLLLAGRGFSVGVKFVAQLIVVRYLSTTDYGAWTYALSAVAFFQALSSLGFNRAVARFLPIYLEKEEYGKFFGTIGLVMAGIVGAGAVIVGGFHLFPEMIGALVGEEAGQSQALLGIVIFLVPLEAFDLLLTGICATFARSRTVFVRRYLIAPSLRLAVAGGLVLFQADVQLLAYGYLASVAAGVAYYLWIVIDVLRGEGLLGHLDRDGTSLPFREITSYTVPVLGADWLTTTIRTSGPLLLGYFVGVDAVALFRVVVPMALLNRIVNQSFTVLFEPVASRLHAREDHPGLSRLYWRTAAWVAVLGFPIFAMSFTAAEPLTVLFFGERYRESAMILSLLALGYYSTNLLGLSGITLKLTGSLRLILAISFVAAVVHVLLDLLLIPPLGAYGAAIGLLAALMLFALLKQMGLTRATGIPFFNRRYLRLYLTIVVAGSALIAVRAMGANGWYSTVSAASAASLAVLLQARKSLNLSETFPELLRFRLLRIVLD